MTGQTLDPSTTRLLRSLARAIALLWAAWWTFFVWATVASEGFLWPGPAVAAALGVLFLGSALLAWRWQHIGGLLLTVEGLLVVIGYPQMMAGVPSATVTTVLLTLALPPLVAGALCLACRERSTR